MVVLKHSKIKHEGKVSQPGRIGGRRTGTQSRRVSSCSRCLAVLPVELPLRVAGSIST